MYINSSSQNHGLVQAALRTSAYASSIKAVDTGTAISPFGNMDISNSLLLTSSTPSCLPAVVISTTLLFSTDTLPMVRRKRKHTLPFGLSMLYNVHRHSQQLDSLLMRARASLRYTTMPQAMRSLKSLGRRRAPLECHDSVPAGTLAAFTLAFLSDTRLQGPASVST